MALLCLNMVWQFVLIWFGSIIKAGNYDQEMPKSQTNTWQREEETHNTDSQATDSLFLNKMNAPLQGVQLCPFVCLF